MRGRREKRRDGTRREDERREETRIEESRYKWVPTWYQSVSYRGREDVRQFNRYRTKSIVIIFTPIK
tara:strand:+ start:468 stop:668 length:201 start_codon:yes stop_codon:yes gene_type:complete